MRSAWGVLLWFVIFLGAFSKSGIIGDSYGPLIGLMLGVPSTLGQLLLGTLPATIYFFRYHNASKTRRLAALLALSILIFLAMAALTAACILTPRSHGSNC